MKIILKLTSKDRPHEMLSHVVSDANLTHRTVIMPVTLARLMDVRWKGGQWLDERLAGGQEAGTMWAIWTDGWLDREQEGKTRDG